MYRACKMNVDVEKKKVVLELLSFCNLNCQHCFYRVSDKFHSADFLSAECIFKLIDKFVENNITKLILTGGELTLHPSFIEISKYAMAKIPKVSLCANGVIPNKELENKVIELDFSTYTVSVDSHIGKVHDEFRGSVGAFKYTINFLRKLKLKNRNISIHITIHPNNIKCIEETIEFCKKFSSEIVLSSIYYDKLNMESLEIKQYNESIKVLKEKYINNTDVILVGFEPYCTNENCLDQKNVFMVNRKGQLVECYWKKNGGKVLKIFSK